MIDMVRRYGKMPYLTFFDPPGSESAGSGPNSKGRVFRTVMVPDGPDYISPGGVAEIRMLLQFDAGELTHVRVPGGKVSFPGRVHPSSEWFFVVDGHGELWDGAHDQVVDLRPDRVVKIAPGTPFQYRAGEGGLTILLAAMPRWKREFHGVLGDGTGGTGRWVASAALTDPLDSRGDLELADRLGVEVYDPDGRDPERHYTAPDGSSIWTLGTDDAGGLALCALPPGGVSETVVSPVVEELWYILAGSGQMSRRWGGTEPEVVDLAVGVSVDLPRGVTFQFRAGDEGLRALLLTMPRWPGPYGAPPAPERATWPTLDQPE